MNLPPYKPTRLIFGLVPWMFWTLLAAVLFSMFGPFAVRAAAADSPATAGEKTKIEKTVVEVKP